MTENPHLSAILDEWHRTKSPGYAVMVTAPWGAGKTFALRQWLTEKTHTYVSLFGVDSIAAFQEALFQAALERDGGNPSRKSAQAAVKAFDGAASLLSGAIGKATNITVDLSAFYRNAVISQLPDLIIFDDLERARLPAPLLLSVLNRFVEHEGKSVILVANEAELDGTNGTTPDAEKADYRRWREKVVGRTITLVPETDAALSAFLSSLSDGAGKLLLLHQKPLIRDVFDRSQTNNLRLLRQSLTDLARFLDRMPETYRNQTHFMPGLIGDFLALSIAWHAGDRLKEKDFDFYSSVRGSLRRMSTSAVGTPETPSGLMVLQSRYKGVPHVNLNGHFLPGKLALRQIVDGHACEADIQTLMKQAGAFDQTIEHSWRKLYFWRHLPEEEVQQAFMELNKDIKLLVFTEPTTILHVFAIQIDLARRGLFDLQSSKVVARAKIYINTIADDGRLLIYYPKSIRPDWRNHGHSDGQEYAANETLEVQDVRMFLYDAMLRQQGSQRSICLKQLFVDLKSDPTRYQRAFWGGDHLLNIPDVSQTLVFQDSDAEAVAQTVFSLRPDRWGIFLSPFKERIELQDSLAAQHADGRPTERDWLKAFNEAAHRLSNAGSPVKRAQMLSALSHHLAFLGPPLESNPEQSPDLQL